MRLTDTARNRLYLNAEERAAFRAAARRQPARDRTLCETLHYDGCRPSELLEVTPARIDLSGGTITIRSLKKRKDASGRSRIVYRSVPVPPEYLDTLNTAHGIREAQKSRKQASAPIRPLSRVRVWQIVKRIMIEAGIPDAPHRSPEGSAPWVRDQCHGEWHPASDASEVDGACPAQHDSDLCRRRGQGRAGRRRQDVGEGPCI